MPTGYTRCIDEDDASFRTFALGCACAFFYDCYGLPERHVPSDYHEKALTKAKEKRAQALSWSPTEASNLAAAEFRRLDEEFSTSERAADVLRERYAAMREQVEAWTPPNAESVQLKSLMLDQLRLSQPSPSSASSEYRPKRLTGPEYRRRAIERADANVAYHAEAWRKDCERAARANEWTAELRASLPAPTDENKRTKP